MQRNYSACCKYHEADNHCVILHLSINYFLKIPSLKQLSTTMAVDLCQRSALVEKEANLLSYGYCRDYANSYENKHIPNDIQYLIFLYFGINKPKTTIDRYGFFTKQLYTYSGRDHLAEIKKENAKLQKWMEFLLPINNSDEQITQNWANIRNNKNLKALIRTGIPSSLRSIIWKNLCGAMERKKIECVRYGSPQLYKDLVTRKKSPYHDALWAYINRTYRKHVQFGAYNYFDDQNIEKKESVKYYKYSLQNTQMILTPQQLEQVATPLQRAVYNSLKVFSLYRKDVGICDGMSAFASLLAMNMTEEDVFWVLASLADDTKYQMDTLWSPNMPAIQLRFYQLERCVIDILPKLNKHFKKHEITSASMYQASQWFITIFLATNMRFDTIYRIWDIYLNEGLKSVFRFGVGFLKYFEKDLINSNFEQMLEIFRTASSSLDTDKYIKISLGLKITHKQLTQYEREFNRLMQQ